MRKLTSALFGLGLTVLVGSGLQAQEGPRADAEGRREAARARREAMEGYRDAMMQHRDALRAGLQSLSPEQRAFFEALRAERKAVGSEIKTGTLTREAAREALRAWIQANRPQNTKQ